MKLSSAAPKVGGFLVRAYAHNVMRPEAEKTLVEVVARTDKDDSEGQAGIASLRARLASR